jgi:hypothetical protein
MSLAGMSVLQRPKSVARRSNCRDRQGDPGRSGKEVAFSVSLSGFASVLSRVAQLNGSKNPG